MIELVIAGNYNQFEQYVRSNDKDLTECRYIHQVHQLVGWDYKKIKITLFGEFWLNPVYDEAVKRGLVNE